MFEEQSFFRTVVVYAPSPVPADPGAVGCGCGRNRLRTQDCNAGLAPLGAVSSDMT